MRTLPNMLGGGARRPGRRCALRRGPSSPGPGPATCGSAAPGSLGSRRGARLRDRPRDPRARGTRRTIVSTGGCWRPPSRGRGALAARRASTPGREHAHDQAARRGGSSAAAGDRRHRHSRGAHRDRWARERCRRGSRLVDRPPRALRGSACHRRSRRDRQSGLPARDARALADRRVPVAQVMALRRRVD